MKRYKALINFFVILLVLLISNVSLGYAENNIPQELIINTENNVLGRVDYKDYTISANKIVSKYGLGYCLEIHKDYPSGQLFKFKGDARPDIINILTEGYPNRSPEQLNLQSEDEAYFATQIAIWSAYEGYDVYKFSGANERVLSAIIDIYEKSKIADKATMTYEGKEYYYAGNTQEVAILSAKIAGGTNELPQTGEAHYYNYMGILGIVFIVVGSYFLIRKPKIQ